MPADEYERRIAALVAAADADWVVVYGDREHNANLAFFCGFDPRFEEALLLLGRDGRRTLVVGNEGLGYVPMATVPLGVALAQSFSLMGQRRDTAPRLADVLARAGIGTGADVAVVGWKYLESAEDDEPDAPAFVPAMLVRDPAAGWLASPARSGMPPPSSAIPESRPEVVATRPRRSPSSPGRPNGPAMRSSASCGGARPGMTELDAAGLMGYQGEPLSCHVMMVGGDRDIVGLCSPGDRVLADGRRCHHRHRLLGQPVVPGGTVARPS